MSPEQAGDVAERNSFGSNLLLQSLFGLVTTHDNTRRVAFGIKFFFAPSHDLTVRLGSSVSNNPSGSAITVQHCCGRSEPSSGFILPSERELGWMGGPLKPLLHAPPPPLNPAGGSASNKHRPQVCGRNSPIQRKQRRLSSVRSEPRFQDRAPLDACSPDI